MIEEKIPKTLKDISKINFKDLNNFLPVKDIDIGFHTKKLLGKSKCKEKDKFIFLKDCQKFLIGTVSKILERSCLNYKIIEGISCINPLIIADPKLSLRRMLIVLEVFYEKKIICAEEAEELKQQFKRFTNSNSNIFKKYNNERLDSYYYSLLKDKDDFCKLWKFIQLILILSHGNASVESGFSVNKQMLVENLKERSLIAQRVVYDNILYVGGTENILINNRMLRYCQQSNRKYKEALQQNRKEEAIINDRKSEKRKIQTEIKNLEMKKQRINCTFIKEKEDIQKKIENLQNNLGF